MPSLRDKIDYLTAIASDRPLTRVDFIRSSEILYGTPTRIRVGNSPVAAHPRKSPRRIMPARFKPGEVEVIRELYHAGGVDYEDLKNWLGVAKSTVCHVIALKGAYKKRNFATDY